MKLTSSASVRNVSRERWLQAQAWERDLWVTSQEKRGWRRVAWPVVKPMLRAMRWRRAWGDDWNHWWADHFDNYRFLPEQLGDYIELGCGPYTNTRLLLPGRKADRVVCSDPLAETYITFPDRWLAKAHREGLVEIDAHPIEELPFEDGSFDAVVGGFVVNHLPHPQRAMAEAARVLAPGGAAAFSVWDRPDRNRLNGVFRDAMADVAVPNLAEIEEGPDPTRFSDDPEFVALLEGAGLSEATVETISLTLTVPDADTLWDGFMGSSVRMRAQVDAQPDDARRRIREAFEHRVEAHRHQDGLEMPVVVKLASARKR
jgi:SAM-dependent methyltransferase